MCQTSLSHHAPSHAGALTGVPATRLMKRSAKGLYGILDGWQASVCAGKQEQTMLFAVACTARSDAFGHLRGGTGLMWRTDRG